MESKHRYSCQAAPGVVVFVGRRETERESCVRGYIVPYNVVHCVPRSAVKSWCHPFNIRRPSEPKSHLSSLVSGGGAVHGAAHSQPQRHGEQCPEGGQELGEVRKEEPARTPGPTLLL